ncbi:MAG: saccharopine dehydrogenase C-terminal domain-containing protein [Chitinophagaceae bacterium]
MKIAVLGAGMVGRAIALDLAKDYQVSSFDKNLSNLEILSAFNNNIRLTQVDLSAFSNYAEWLRDFDVVVTAVPGFMGYSTLEAVINSGKNVVDISFFPENALELNQLAIQNNCTVITDCGVAPGMSNFIIGRYNSEMEITSIDCYVGGLPQNRIPPFEYKAPFSPVDVIQEYIRPARLKENGTIVTKPAMSEIERLTFDGIGTLEAFNTDGLRTLLFTMPHIPDMKEKTLRYPGHAKLITDLQAAGFFRNNPISVKGQSVIPLDFTSQLLIDQWKLHPGEEELTVMRVTLRGRTGIIEYNLLDHYDTTTGLSSMARTTGFTCTAAVNLITKKMFTKKGIFPPELIGNDQQCFDFVIRYLKDRGVNWKRTIQ